LDAIPSREDVIFDEPHGAKNNLDIMESTTFIIIYASVGLVQQSLHDCRQEHASWISEMFVSVPDAFFSRPMTSRQLNC
jgi:hypothetical protein